MQHTSPLKCAEVRAMQDNAPPHKAKMAFAWLAKERLPLLKGPAFVARSEPNKKNPIAHETAHQVTTTTADHIRSDESGDPKRSGMQFWGQMCTNTQACPDVQGQ